MSVLKNVNLFAKETGIPKELFEEIYALESDFFQKISKEPDFNKRQELYSFVYQKVAEITSDHNKDYFWDLVREKTKIASLFKNELQGKSIIDIGSGSGAFLYAISKMGINYKSLYGMDVKAPSLPKDDYSKKIDLLQQNAIKFSVPQPFEVAMLDNVYEHIALQDLDLFLDSVSKSLQPGGKLILLIPHKDFGPSDWTKLLDNTFSGAVNAHCLHLNETTYTETINALKKHGFVSFSAVNPFKTLVSLNTLFPNLRLPVGIFTFLEKSAFLTNLLKLIKINGRCFFRMQVSLIAQKAK